MATPSPDRTRPPLAGVCLAAGASSRMGSPKALLDFGGRTALACCVDALAGGGCDPVIVVLGAKAAEVRAAAGLPESARVVVHAGWESGRSGSLNAGIRAAEDAAAWVLLPVDHPLVTSGDVRALIRAWGEKRAPVVRPVRDGRGGHPALLDAVIRDEILALGDDEPLRDVVRRHREREVTVPGSPATLVDVNTPEDYRRALKAMS